MNETIGNADAPPDWEARSSELLCPLCEYNLRGLTVPRCPECGFAFRWAELIEAERNKHKYLFEHAEGFAFKSFCKTYWRTSWPRRFWKDLNPAQPVMRGRLILYWAITLGIAFLATGGTKGREILQTASFNMSVRNSVAAPPWFSAQYPLPWEWSFWERILFGPQRSYYRIHDPSAGAFLCILAVWPFLTLLALMVFRFSMRQAKIQPIHLLRTAIYSCDFGLLMAGVYAAAAAADLGVADGWFEMIAVVACVVMTSYRMTIAFRQYLRVHLPFATVIASQIIAMLILFVLLAQIADFSRQV